MRGLLKRLSLSQKILFSFLVSLALCASLGFLVVQNTIFGQITDLSKTRVREVVQTGYSIIEQSYELFKKGEISESEAKSRAINMISGLRYGPENSDYFWINDYNTKMIMHPTNPKLDGQDVSHIKDAAGNAIFVKMVEVVKKDKQGFVSYEWQFKNEKGRIEPKISFVKGFEPWGWILGSGVYTVEVRSVSLDISYLVGEVFFFL